MVKNMCLPIRLRNYLRVVSTLVTKSAASPRGPRSSFAHYVHAYNLLELSPLTYSSNRASLILFLAHQHNKGSLSWQVTYAVIGFHTDSSRSPLYSNCFSPSFPGTPNIPKWFCYSVIRRRCPVLDFYTASSLQGLPRKQGRQNSKANSLYPYPEPLSIIVITAVLICLGSS